MTTDPTPLVDGDAFVAAMTPLTEALSRWAMAWADQPERYGYLPTADSKGMAELNAEPRWATQDWELPVRNAHNYGVMVCRALAEHLAALATIIVHSPMRPAYGHLPPVRAIFEAVPIAHWLLDPAIDVETRLNRSITHRLKSANETRRIKSLPTVVADGDRARQKSKEFAWAHGWTIKHIKATHEEIVQGAPRPRPQDVYTEIATGTADRDRDAALWSVICAGQHSTQYMLGAAFRDGITRPDPIDPRSGLAPIVVDTGLVAEWVWICWRGCDGVATARNRLMGWRPDGDLRDSAADVRRHAAIFRPASAAAGP